MKYVKDGKVYNEVKTVVLECMRIINPTHEQILSAGYEVYIEPIIPVPTPQQLLDEAKEEKKTEVVNYSKSENIKVFYIGEDKVWFDSETRASLKLRIESEKKDGRETTNLWYNGKQYIFNVDDALDLLSDVELYASDCFDATEIHKADIDELETIEDVESYDYTVNYPEILHFNYE